jgi:PTH1 family peptidyl-tRNA hydrolase
MLFQRQEPGSTNMKLVVGLGNIGTQYTNTRHNIGFEVAGELARRNNVHFHVGKFKGEEAELRLEGQRILLLKPHTLMNLSGDAVVAAMRFYKLLPAQLLIICDDINLPLGKLRIRAQGSDGGHNGLWHVIHRLGTPAFPRLRIGVGEKPAQMELVDYVLSRFLASERPVINAARDHAAMAAESWIIDGIEATMNRWNADLTV